MSEINDVELKMLRTAIEICERISDQRRRIAGHHDIPYPTPGPTRMIADALMTAYEDGRKSKP